MNKLDWVVLLLAVITIIGLAVLYFIIINPDILNAYLAPGQDLGRIALA